MVNSARRGQLETGVLRQVFTIRQGSAQALRGLTGFSGLGFPFSGLGTQGGLPPLAAEAPRLDAAHASTGFGGLRMESPGIFSSIR
jgi:hypothetical protein